MIRKLLNEGDDPKAVLIERRKLEGLIEYIEQFLISISSLYVNFKSFNLYLLMTFKAAKLIGS